jgi:hypothetical protein
MERNMVLLSVSPLIKAQLRESDKENAKIVCKNLLQFAYDKNLLLENPFNSNGEIDLNLEIRESDLNEIGRKIFYNLMLKWLSYTDKTNKIDNVGMLEKYYNKLTEKL